MTDKSLRPVERKLLAVLADGLAHSIAELGECMPTGDGDMATVKVHVCRIRKVLRPRGEDIICEMNSRRIFYRHVVLLAGRR
jgi:hypothetical protein